MKLTTRNYSLIGQLLGKETIYTDAGIKYKDNFYFWGDDVPVTWEWPEPGPLKKAGEALW